MRKICPQCQGNFDTQLLCPKCGVQMLDVPDRSAIIAAAAAEEGLHASSVGRQLLAGLLLAQGIYYAAQQLSAAFASWPDGLGLPAAAQHMPTAMQVFGVLLAGFVVGAGNRRAVFAGAGIGVLNAVLLVGAQIVLHGRPSEFMLFAAWLAHGVFGAVGACFGRLAWPALQDLPDRATPRKVAKEKRPSGPPAPLAWFRVMGGAALSVGCTVWAGAIRDWLVTFAGGTFILESRLQGQFITWVIAALAMIIGGAFAGVLARGGLKHGFLVGLLASVGIFVIHQEVVKEILPPEHFFYSVTGLPAPEQPTPGTTALFLLTNTLLLGTLGGFFGSMLLPRLAEPGTGKLDRGAI